MNVEFLARIQFALTAAFHYFYPPLTIGLSLIIVIMEGIFLKTKNPRFHDMAYFWTRIFGLIFAIGVATGIVMEFEFGTNWATYSRFVGDIFGSALAAEGIFAFFLESGFLAILLFGWDKVSPKIHFLSACMVCFGSHFSAVWIVIANSWMQTPAGYHLEVNDAIVPPDYILKPEDLANTRAVIDDFWAMLLNPSSIDRLTHVIFGCWLAGAFLVMSVSAFYILKNRHLEFARSSLKIALIFATLTIFLQFFSGDDTARGVAENQPIKLAAIEGLWDTQPEAPFSIIGWVDSKNQKTYDIAIPGLLSLLTYHDIHTPVEGLHAFPREDYPPVNFIYQTYRIMIAFGILIFLICILSLFLLKKDRLFDTNNIFSRNMLRILVIAVLFPQIANQAGWFTAEVGRQPWIVWHLLRTSEGLSKVVSQNQVVFSLILFISIYTLLFITFLYLMNKKIQHGPIYKQAAQGGSEKWYSKHTRAGT